MVFAVDVASSTSIAMSRAEAEEITLAIQQNFDSLGLMLDTARNRKAWKALNYKDFGSYCNNEFGKSQSRAYELIEEAKIAQTLKEEGGQDLRLPAASNLKLLKDLPVEKQVEAIKYSEQLASAADQKKPNRNHLLFAINKVSGTHSTEDLKSSLEALGFTKGVEVATIRGVNIGSRGFIRKLDKRGQLYVELHSSGRVPLPYDAASLRILSDSEKPEKAASPDSTNIGDKVLIFSSGLDGTLGTIQARISGDKMVGVKVKGELLKLPYAELEVVEVEIDEPEQDSWLQNFVWTDFGTQWCYDSESCTISTTYQNLKLHPTEKGRGSPADWVKRWVEKNIPNLACNLLPPDQLTTLIQSRLITCGGEEEKGNLAESIIAKIWKMSLPVECRQKISSLLSDKADKARGISFGLVLRELESGKKTQTRRAWQDDYAKSFIRYFEEKIEIPALDKGQHRGGKEVGKIRLTEKPYQQMLSEMPASDLEKEGAMCATVQDFIDRFFEGQDKLVWVLNFEFFPNIPDEQVAQSQAVQSQLLTRINELNGQILQEKEATNKLQERLAEADRVIEQMLKIETKDAPIQVEVVNTKSTNSEVEQYLADLKQAKEEIDALATTFEWGDVGYPDNQGQIVKYDDWTEHNTVEPLAVDTLLDTLLDTSLDTAEAFDVEAVDTSLDTTKSSENNQEILTPGDTAAPTESSENNQEISTSLPDRMEAQIGLLVRIYGNENGKTYKIHQIGAIEINCMDIATGFTEWIDKRILRVVVDQPMVAELVDATTASTLDVPESPDNLAGNNTTVDTAEVEIVDTELGAKIAEQRKKVREVIARDNRKLKNANKKESIKLNQQIDDSYSKLLELDAFEKVNIGQTVEKKIRVGVYGTITQLDFSRGGMPQVHVKWGNNKLPQTSNIFSLNCLPAISPPTDDLPPDIQEDIRLLRENLIAWKAHAEEELAAAEEHNKSIFTRKIEARNSKIEQLQEFSKLRVGQYVIDKLSPKRGKVLAMHAKTESIAIEIEWECGKTELTPFTNIVPEQMK